MGEMIERPAVLRLDVLCNNPDNGLFVHHAEGLQVTTWDGEDIEFTCQRMRAPRFVELPGGFRFMRLRWNVLRTREWYGNWCWNAYWLTLDDLLMLLARVKSSGIFSCDHAPTQLFENWNEGAALDKALWSANMWGRHSIGVIDA